MWAGGSQIGAQDQRNPRANLHLSNSFYGRLPSLSSAAETHSQVPVLHIMQLLAGLAFFAYLRAVAAHGGHEHDGPQPGETVVEYAARHVSTSKLFSARL